MSEVETDSKTSLNQEVLLNDIQPKTVLSKLPFNSNKCPLFLSKNGNATALYRYSNSGPFIELFDPFNNNLIQALKYSIIQGNFCIFNFGLINDIDQISQMLDELKKRCSLIHIDLYNHIINNSLMKQSFDTLMSLIPFDPIYEMVPEIYRNTKASFRFLFFAQINDPSIQINNSFSSIFNCIQVKT
ncbi:unnamed protein product [Adineta steineri]|uniref:Uncharacterized protein n=1 Tax=Adineta steineri TaxID=433720 RepID=A0A813NQ97_9BILA|nr:unnamed protein product [Adineta steineri]CAF3545300.1 unnamed protein product [Adineta steineri]